MSRSRGIFKRSPFSSLSCGMDLTFEKRDRLEWGLFDFDFIGTGRLTPGFFLQFKSISFYLRWKDVMDLTHGL